MIADTTPIIDTTALQSQLTTTAFGQIIESVLPIVGVAVLVGFICYMVRFAIRLFRGV